MVRTDDTADIWAIQLLRNAVGGGRVSDFPEKNVTNMYGSTLLALGGCRISRKKPLRNAIIRTYFFCIKLNIYVSCSMLYILVCRWGGSGCWRSAPWVVPHHVARDIQPNVRSLHDVSRRSRHLHHQPFVTLQLEPPQLLQVCGARHGEGYLWQQVARMLLHAILLQAHPWSARQVRR